MICEYGCGKEAKYKLKNGKWCCNKFFQQCPAKKIYGKKPWNKGKKGIYSEETINKMRKNSSQLKGKTYEEIHGIDKAIFLKELRGKELSKRLKGQIPWNKGKKDIYSIETIKRISKSNIKTIDDYKKDYPKFFKIEDVKLINNKIYVRCKKCNNWFEPSKTQFRERIRSIKKPSGNANCFMFCSDECKYTSNDYFKSFRVDPETLSKFKLYSSKVWKFTNYSLKKYSKKIKNFELRGRNKYHLDHKFSILEGFKQNIEPKLIAHWKNLEMLPEHENIKKGSLCSITFDELKILTDK